MTERETQETVLFLDMLDFILKSYEIEHLPKIKIFREDIYPFYIWDTGYFIAQYNRRSEGICYDLPRINTVSAREDSSFLQGPTASFEIALLNFLQELLPTLNNFDKYFTFKSVNNLCMNKNRGDNPEVIAHIMY